MHTSYLKYGESVSSLGIFCYSEAELPIRQGGAAAPPTVPTGASYTTVFFVKLDSRATSFSLRRHVQVPGQTEIKMIWRGLGTHQRRPKVQWEKRAYQPNIEESPVIAQLSIPQSLTASVCHRPRISHQGCPCCGCRGAPCCTRLLVPLVAPDCRAGGCRYGAYLRQRLSTMQGTVQQVNNHQGYGLQRMRWEMDKWQKIGDCRWSQLWPWERSQHWSLVYLAFVELRDYYIEFICIAIF